LGTCSQAPKGLFDDATTEPTSVLFEGPAEVVALLVGYDGSSFSGFAPQPGRQTVGGALRTELERRLRHSVVLTCAGRTDAGVHAWGQVVSFETRAGTDLEGLARSLNRSLGPKVAVRSVAPAPWGFSARHSASGRIYRYRIWNRAHPNPFLASYSWHVPGPLDLAAMRLAADALVGEHDFASFCRRHAPDASLVRRVTDARVSQPGPGLVLFEVHANAFCHQMVRSMVGTLAAVGTGRLRAGEMTSLLRARCRQAAGPVAPPGGLCLWQVLYPKELAPSFGPEGPQATGWAW
jgi:tRNA pseudouridine38-40 synthase